MMDELETTGFVLRARIVSDSSLGSLLRACVPAGAEASVHRRSGLTYGLRGLLWSSPSLRTELERSGLDALAAEALEARAFPIDAIFFDKQEDANWSVPGHQDRIMPVAPGCAGAKARRTGIDYAEPTAATLSGLVALRVHFDDVDAAAGALQVVSGSHQRGVLAPGAIRAVSIAAYQPCAALRGDVLLMRPLLLHRSGRRVGPGHRRVLHVVYAAEQPTEPLRWRSPRLLSDPAPTTNRI